MENIKIGVGVITVGVRPLKDYLVTDPRADFRVFNDPDRKGVAYARNELMHQFYEEGYDYWFIFDDDCYPVMEGWETYFVDQAVSGGWDFFGMPEYFKDKVVGSKGEVILWELAMCQFAMYSRAVVEKMGYFRPYTHGYGFEDAEWGHRLKAAGLNHGIQAIPCPLRIMAYIHPDDVFGNNPMPFANLTKEEKEAAIGINWEEYKASLEDIKNGKIRLSYEEALAHVK